MPRWKILQHTTALNALPPLQNIPYISTVCLTPLFRSTATWVIADNLPCLHDTVQLPLALPAELSFRCTTLF